MTRSEGSNGLTHAKSALAIMVSVVDYYGQETIASLYVPFVKQQVLSAWTDLDWSGCMILCSHWYNYIAMCCYPGLHACMAKGRN